MHIEVGIIDPARVALANAAALSLIATQLPSLIRHPLVLPKAVLAAVAFSAMMQIWHLPVGPSELHLIGATTIYLLFGFTPAMLGFALGLVLQAFLFEPGDILHLGVNALSLMLPMLVVHLTFGRRLFSTIINERLNLARVLRLDATYYMGVSMMVGFWLSISNDGLAFSDWARWVLAYAPVFLVEACITYGVVLGIKRLGAQRLTGRLTEVHRLTFA
ncbi:energy-coupling factor ABC transporter permease [Allorhizobium taibaishanense]|uniref:ABC-type Co2+ transport system permease subunit n=1 Tax=Allorhizobium taibaishanense TaxID=887144 RepID=A0A1Q9ABN2_9HYPH|nr:energy-coupling factor ABC transporter permease [Allorhizobium taibaishanense]MBB4010672.1 ABC-type Co2+ transport system permease subunit [Allorhizobium taibaishanense]OLP52237.1 cobalamin biosynthesis protein CbiM [Allorhizobium taibaishanense]